MNVPFPVRAMSEVAEVTSAKRIFAADYVSVGVPFYRGKEITELHNGALNVSTDLFITEDKFSDIRLKHGSPDPGDILLTSVGTLGSVYLVKGGDRFYFKDGNVTWFRKLNGLSGNYLRYWLLSPEGRAQLQKCVIGSSQSAYTIDNLKKIEIAVPPLETQRRIASVLGAYDDLIEVNRRRVAVLEEMARGLFDEWFVRFRFPGHEAVESVETVDGPLPEGWARWRLARLVSATYGYTTSAVQNPIGPKFLRVMDINKSAYIDWDAVPYAPFDGPTDRFKLLQGDLVVARMADTGKVGRIDEDVDAIAASYLVRLRPVTYSDSLFLFYLLTAKAYQDYVSGASTGSTRKSASVPVLTGFQFACPPVQLREHFSLKIASIRSQAAILIVAIARLRSMRDLLLPRLVSGHLSVGAAERELEEAA